LFQKTDNNTLQNNNGVVVMAQKCFVNQRNTEERNKLIVQYRYLPIHVVKKMKKRLPCIDILGRDDAIQIAFLRLIRCAELWRENDKASFKTYAHRAMWLGLIEESDRQARSTLNRAKTLFVQGINDNEKDMVYDNWLPVTQDCDQENKIDIRQAYKKLPPRTQDILYNTDVLDQTYETVGQKYLVSRERIRQIREKALQWLRAYLGGENPRPLQDYISRRLPKETKQ
jgi:RNA polymerase sigma factor (sigma-70 family)